MIQVHDGDGVSHSGWVIRHISSDPKPFLRALTGVDGVAYTADPRKAKRFKSPEAAMQFIIDNWERDDDPDGAAELFFRAESL